MHMYQYAGQKIKKLRKTEQMTQTKLASLLGTTRQTISQYESGNKKANQDILFKLATIFKTSINDFFPPIQQFTHQKQVKKIINQIDDSLTSDELEQIVTHISYIKCRKGK